MRFANKSAIVTGAASGIGLAVAERLAAEGAAVVSVDLSTDLLTRLPALPHPAACRTRSAGGDHYGALADVTDESDVRRVVTAARALFTDGVDLLVNCVGGSGGAGPEPIEQVTLESWERTVSFNLTGTFLSCREVVPEMKSKGYGKVVNLASIAARGAGSAPTSPAYGTAKAAVIAFTKALAVECAPFNVNCNVVAPGFTMSERIRESVWSTWSPAEQQAALDRIPLRRYSEPWDQANAVLFLLSDEARNITGITVDVNGGLFMP